MADKVSVVRPQRRQLLLLLLIAVGLYVLLPQLGDFRQSFGLLRHIRWPVALAAAGFTALTYLASAGTYCLLAFKRLRYWSTVLVELAGMFVNRLLPAGIGALGVNYVYLRRSQHTKTQAVTVVTINNLLGIIGHLLLTAVIVAVFHSHLPPIHLHNLDSKAVWLSRGGILLALSLTLVAWRWRQRLQRGLDDLVAQLSYYRRQPWRLGGALLTSMSLTMCNVVGLWLCLLALHGSLSFVAVLLVFSLGISLGTATPTPGGLGGIEAGLVAGLVVYHVPSSQALAAVLLYRLISYWLPLLVGALAFIIAQRRELLKPTTS